MNCLNMENPQEQHDVNGHRLRMVLEVKDGKIIWPFLNITLNGGNITPNGGR